MFGVASGLGRQRVVDEGDPILLLERLEDQFDVGRRAAEALQGAAAEPEDAPTPVGSD